MNILDTIKDAATNLKNAQQTLIVAKHMGRGVKAAALDETRALCDLHTQVNRYREAIDTEASRWEY